MIPTGLPSSSLAEPQKCPAGPATPIKNPGEQGCCYDVDRLRQQLEQEAVHLPAVDQGAELHRQQTGHGFSIGKAKATVQ
jgi:hypothetical protein